MDGIKIDVIGNVARVIERPARITAGTVGLPIEFTFDEQWDGLSKTAVFRGSGTTKIVESLGSDAIVPWEVLKKPNTYLHVGVYGTNSNGTVVIATIWANVLGICKGVNPDGDVSTDPTLPVWQKLLNHVGDLLNLRTQNKNNLVDAINEVHSIACSGGIETDPTLTKEGRAADAKATGDVIRNLTAEDVGARPATWTPTAADVGARPNTWTPTAADVGARPNTWMPTAEDVGARPNTWVPTANQIGLGNVDNTSDIDKPVSTEQAKAIADAKKARYYNLLKNSNFANPVNTKGQSSYKGAVEGINDWSCTSGNWMVTVKDGYIEVSDNPDVGSTSTMMLRQYIPVDASLRGKTVTLCAKLKGVDVRLNINNAVTGAYAGKDDWYVKVATGTVPADAETIFVALQSRNMVTWCCEWVALYEGEYTAETLPEYQPKGYMVEALDCGALTVHETITLPANGWSGSAPYSQTVSVEGINADDNPHVSPVYSDTLATALTQKEAWEMVSRAKSNANAITFYCFEEKPAVDIPVQIEVNR